MQALTHEDAERTVLGCILSSADATCIDCVSSQLRPEHFSLSSHRSIFAAINRITQAGQLPDDLLLTTKLIESGQLESVGGVGYITSLSDNVVKDVARVTSVSTY